jgi:hypothetical protein
METPRPTEQLALFWESEVVSNPNGSVTLRATVPLSHMSRKQAARAIGCTPQVITNLFRLGMLKGYKPGGWRVRKDGRASNAKLRLCSESVLMYKRRQELAALEWQASQEA